jgi:hypothetical protein
MSEVLIACSRKYISEKHNRMPTVFSRSTRALAVDRGTRSLLGLVLAAALLGVWGTWTGLACLTVYAVTDTARLEVDRVVHPVEAPVDGRVVATHLALGRLRG